MLLAAAAVLTAIQWDNIGQTAKLTGLVAVTVGLLLGGRRLSAGLPMTGSALFHLGALLIPFDMAAVSMLAGHGWQHSLALTGLSSTAWLGLQRIEPSVVMAWAGRASAVFVAAGLAAVTPVSMPLIVAGFGLIAIAGLDKGRVCTLANPAGFPVWSGVAAVLPLTVAVDVPARLGSVVDDLGLNADSRWQLLAAGALATLTFGVATWRRPGIELFWCSTTAAVATAAVAASTITETASELFAASVVFVAVELAALALARRSPGLAQRLHFGIVFGEVIAGLSTLGTIAYLLDIALFSSGTVPLRSAAALVLAIGWLIADARRVEQPVDWLNGAIYGGDLIPTTMFVPALMWGAVGGLVDGSPRSTTLTVLALVLATWAALTGRAGGSLVAAAMLGTAAVTATQTWATLGAGAFGIALMVVTTRSRFGSPTTRTGPDAYGPVLAAIAAWAVAVQASAASDHWMPALFTVGAGAFAILAGWGQRGPRPELWIARAAVGVAPLAVVADAWPGPDTGAAHIASLVGCLTAGALYLADAFARPDRSIDRQALVVAGSICAAVGAVPLLAWLDTDAATAGMILAAGGLVATALALIGPKDRLTQLGFVGVAVTWSILGIVSASVQEVALAAAISVAGCSLLMAGAARRQVELAIPGWLGICAGSWLYLSHPGEPFGDWIEAYLVTPAIGALAAGAYFHRRGTSSWLAFAPTVAVLAGVSIVERLDGGSGWHSVIAGTVAVAAVIVAGWRRLIGPLAVGTVALAVVCGYELLGPAALVPVWAWLAIGGAALVVAAVVLERSETGPVETGRDLLADLEAIFT